MEADNISEWLTTDSPFEYYDTPEEYGYEDLDMVQVQRDNEDFYKSLQNL
jgi:hypothetical protein